MGVEGEAGNRNGICGNLTVVLYCSYDVWLQVTENVTKGITTRKR